MRTPTLRVAHNNPRVIRPAGGSRLYYSWLPKKRDAIKVTRIEPPDSTPVAPGRGVLAWVKQHPVAAGVLTVGGFFVLPGLIFSTIGFAAKIAFYGAVAVGGVIVVGKVVGKLGNGGGGGSGNGNYRI